MEMRQEELRAALRAKETEAKELRQQLADKDRRLEALTISKEQVQRQLSEQLEAFESERRKDRQRLEEKDFQQQLSRRSAAVDSLWQQLHELRRQAEQQSQDIKQQSQDIKMLVRWVGKLDNGISALLDSRQWKTGQALGELYRKIMRR